MSSAAMMEELPRLPPLVGMEDDGDLVYSQCHLSDDPSAAAGGCVVVVVVVEGCDNTLMWYCRPGEDDQWVKYDYDIGGHVLPYPDGDRYEKVPICPMAARGGKFYFNSLRNELRVLEFCPDPVFSSVTLVESEDDDDQEDGHVSQRPASVFHVESGGDLYMVKLYYGSDFSNREIVEGVVDKMDFAEMRWRRVDDLGGRTFFLSRFYFGVLCSCGETGAKRDCVYTVTPRKKEMLVFDVKDGTLNLHKLDDEAPFADKAFWLLPKEDSRHV
ncbi:hypothetical protein PR202_ga08740 [Eleusine coracana subsp. coracana]|uniref:KIB1-4 beta-propeller domain-containing protein n=1 Tax=Eleusine coracana subsp. coracana TaxID=191504 RepID=A0AAV5C256_ELECO|nr:hypothetical protein PR202_ga08740 [Eleusine coracana subsp. coracana]